MNKTMNSWLKLSMSHLKFRRTAPLYALATLSLSAPFAHSITLGELQLQSYVGQQFHGLVPYRLNAGESLNEQCIELRSANNELPSMGAATIRLRPSGEQSGFVVIESRSAVGEPTVAFSIKVACGNQQFTRDFTAFLNIAPINNEREALARSVARDVEKKPRDFELVPLKDTEQFVVKKPISLKELTKRYYPANTPQYPRFLQKLSNTNPDLDPNAELNVGTTVIIPERLRSSRKKPAPMAMTESGQLRLDAATTPAQTSTAPVSSAQYAKELEQKVKMLEELQLKMQLEVEQLNTQLSQMKALNASPVATIMPSAVLAASNTASIVQAAAIRTPQARQQAAASEPVSQHSNWLIALPLLLLAALAAVFVWRRKTSEDEWSPEQAGAPTLLGQRSPFIQRKVTEHATMMSLMHEPGAGIEVSDYGSHDLAQIQIMLAQGDVAEAIDLLYKSIDEDPEDIERWLMLFRIFRQQGMKTEYAALAKNLRMIVKDEADWELVRNIGAKLDPENHLYRRTENPLADVVDSARVRPTVPHVELDIHPEPTPASMMHAFLEIEAKPYVPQPSDAVIDEPMTDILLDLHLPETTGDLIQDSQLLEPELETIPVFAVDFLPPLNEAAAEIEVKAPSPEPSQPNSNAKKPSN